jgi:APA family basic amino acid/polyamine antiporter
VALKLAIVFLIIGVGLGHINTANWHPFIPPNTGEWGTYGWSGILRGAGLVFFAYIGFDAVSTAAQESRNPQRDLPIGILGSLAICTVLYVVVSAVLLEWCPTHSSTCRLQWRTPWSRFTPRAGYESRDVARCWTVLSFW